MVEENDLGVLFALNFLAHADTVLFLGLKVRIDIDDLSVTPVSEEKPGLRVGIDLEVGRVIVDNLLALPRIVR